MTTVFVYEYCCAVGLGRDESDPAHSLYREGRAMRDAVADDFRRLPGVEMVTLDGSDEVAEPDQFRRLAAGSNWSLLVLPELFFLLDERSRITIDAGGQLLGPSPDAIRLTSDKLALADHWTHHNIPKPVTSEAKEWPSSRVPVVIKPRYGAGSWETKRFDRPMNFPRLCRIAEPNSFDPAALDAADREDVGYFTGQPLAQDYVPGRPASVAFLIGPRETVPLVPTFQVLSADGRFRYLGGELPIRPDLAGRAISLGRRAIECVPGLRGYVGVDLILGDAADGSRDYAIEINPRLTTSYVGLRQLADFNLAGAMLAVATGEPVGELRWKSGRVRFHPDGRVEHDPTPGATFG